MNHIHTGSNGAPHRLAVAAMSLSIIAGILPVPPVLAESQPAHYTVKGKPVSKQVYQAAVSLNEALPLINSGHLPQAVEKLTQALKLDPNLTEAQYDLGLVLSRQGKAEQSIPHFQAAIDSGANLPSAWTSLASIYQKMGKFDKAAELYDAAFKKFPASTWQDELEVHYNYGLALGKLGQTTNAIEQIKLAAPKMSSGPTFWLTLGALYQVSGKIRDSIDTYKEFFKRFPGHPEAPRIRAAVTLMEKELKASGGSTETAAGAGLSPANDYFQAIAADGLKKWSTDQMPLRVYVKPGQAARGFKPYYDDILKQSFQEWVTAANGKISIQYVNDPSQAVIKCSWGDNPAHLANRAEGGESRLYVDEQGRIARATITVLTVPLTPLRPVTDNLIRFVCLHEIGHALGVSGHSTNPGDVMFFSSDVLDERKHVSARDAATLNRLYPGPGSEHTADQSHKIENPPN